MPEQRWVRIAGDGLVYTGPCLLTHVIMDPDANQDYADIYDGRDATTGRKFCRVQASTRTTRHISLGPGARFDVGLYIDAKDSAVETTVLFIPVD